MARSVSLDVKKNLLLLLGFDHRIVHQEQRIRYNNYAKPTDQSAYRNKFFTNFLLTLNLLAPTTVGARIKPLGY